MRRRAPAVDLPGLSDGVHGSSCDPLMARRLIIGEPLAFNALENFCRAHGVVNAELDPVAVTEIEFREISVQMRLTDGMIGSVDPALEKAEIVLADVDRHNEAGAAFDVGVFVAAVIDAAMLGKFAPHLRVG